MTRLKKAAVVFLKLWLFMFFSYLMVALSFDLAVHGWVDLRQEALTRLLYIPLGQALAFQFLTSRRRSGGTT